MAQNLECDNCSSKNTCAVYEDIEKFLQTMNVDYRIFGISLYFYCDTKKTVTN